MPDFNSSESFQKLICLARDGDEVAARRIVDEFTGPLVAVARRQISEQMATRFEAEDVVQSTYRSLFIRMRRGEYELGNGKDLWKLVVTMMLNKIRRKAKFHSAHKRSVQHEQPLTHIGGTTFDPPGNEATPESAVELVDTLRAFLADVGSRDRPILELRLQGLATDEIAEQTGRAQRSVRRVLQNLRERLEQAVLN